MSTSSQTKTPQRAQFREADLKEPSAATRVLNQAFLELTQRVEALETASVLVELNDVIIETGATVAPTVAPFAGGGVRVTSPVTPSGLVKLRLEQLEPGGQPVSVSSHDVHWHFAAGATVGGGSDGVVVVDYVSGLAANSRYRLRLGVTRRG